MKRRFSTWTLSFILAGCVSADPFRGQDATEQTTSPDGLIEAIVYTRAATRNMDVYLFEEPGGMPRPLIDDPALDYNAVFSPDGRWVVFTSERNGSADLYALDLETDAAPVRLTKHPAMDDAASFSPDGRRLTFVSTRDGDADIFVMPFAPGDSSVEERAVNLTRRPGGDFNPTFSPNGRHIAFSRQPCLWEGEKGYHCVDIQLCLMDADGSNVRALSTSQAGIPPEVEEIEKEVVAGSPAWSPDGEAIYYYSQHTYYLSSPDGGEEEVDAGPEIRRVTLAGGDELVARNGYSPAAGPDGRIAFVRPRDDDGPPRYSSGRVFSVGADGSDLRLESASLPGCLAPDFHRGTGRMVCHGFAPAEGLVNDFGLPFAPPGGIRRVELPDRTLELRGVRGAFPALTTDGEVVSTIRGNHRRARWREGNDSKGLPLHVSAIDGTGSRELFTPPSGAAWAPDVAQEAGWVVLTVGQSFSGARENVDIWKVRLDGSGATNLSAGYDFNAALPSISDDGGRIVFRRPRDAVPGAPGDSSGPGEMAIYVMEIDGKNPYRLTDSEVSETMPALSPDGEWVVYSAYSGGSMSEAVKLWLSRVDGSGSRLLEPDRSGIPDMSMHPTFSADGKWVVFTSDRAGLNDEWPLTFNIQPYGELFAVPVAGGAAVRLTHNKWEDGPSDWGYVRLPDRE